MAHICFLTYISENFKKCYKNYEKILKNHTIIVICDENNIEEIERDKNQNLIIVTKKMLNSFLKNKLGIDANFFLKGKYSGKRNAALLVSCILSSDEDIIFFDDDTMPVEDPIQKHITLLDKFYLSQGKYIGHYGNSLYSLVELFQEYYKIQKRIKKLDEKKVELYLFSLCGKDESKGIKGAVGGNLGISSKLKNILPFIPIDERGEDNFYEFISRYTFGDKNFMSDNTVKENEIPVVKHKRFKSKNPNLFENLKTEIEGIIIETYLIRKILGDKDVQINEIKKRVMKRSAISKFKKACLVYLNEPEIVKHKESKLILEKVLNIDIKVEQEAAEESYLIFKKAIEIYPDFTKKISNQNKLFLEFLNEYI